MSRGLGAVQRAVLAAVNGHPDPDYWWSVTEVTAEVFGQKDSTQAQIESVRRAIKSLAADRLVHAELLEEAVDVRAARVDRGDMLAYRDAHVASRAHLYVHTALSVEEENRRGQLWRETLDQLAALDRRIDR